MAIEYKNTAKFQLDVYWIEDGSFECQEKWKVICKVYLVATFHTKIKRKLLGQEGGEMLEFITRIFASSNGNAVLVCDDWTIANRFPDFHPLSASNRKGLFCPEGDNPENSILIVRVQYSVKRNFWFYQFHPNVHWYPFLQFVRYEGKQRWGNIVLGDGTIVLI